MRMKGQELKRKRILASLLSVHALLPLIRLWLVPFRGARLRVVVFRPLAFRAVDFLPVFLVAMSG